MGKPYGPPPLGRGWGWGAVRPLAGYCKRNGDTLQGGRMSP